jgi:hypothetical protein
VRRVSFISIAVLVLLGLAPTEGGAQPSALVSSNGVLVFGSDRDGEPDLFTIDPSTLTVTKLTTRSGAAELQPAWSPDGAWVGYWDEKDGAIKKISIEGGPAITLTPPSSAFKVQAGVTG